MIGTVVGGRFKLEREAGSGGMGTVYRAHDLVAGQVVALKLLASDEVKDAERFGQEAAILARLCHPAIVRYVDHGTAGGQAYLAMEWLEGMDLDTRVDREPLSLRQGLVVLRRTAEALDYAHREGVVHRDLKPQNLFLPGGEIDALKLLDFGIARLTRVSRRLTQTGVLIGTPGYLAPEIITGAREVDGRADLFSLGCLVYRCLAGRPPFTADDPGQLLSQMLLHEPPALAELVPSVPPALAELVRRLLAKTPEERPADAQAVLAALAALGDVTDAAAGYRKRRNSVSLTLSERRLAAVLLVGPAEGSAAPPEDLGDLSAAAGAPANVAADGSIAFLLPSGGKSTEMATRAARAALGLRPLLPERALVVVAGQVPTGDGEAALAELRAAGQDALARAPRGRIVLAELLAALLETRFELVREGAFTLLAGDRESLLGDGKRRLLGKTTEFLGRSRELGSLTGMMSACADEGAAQAALVVGAAGIGKSRLVHEFLVQALRQSPTPKVLFGIGDSLAAGSPFGILAKALRRHAQIVDGEPLEVSRRKLAAAVGGHLPRTEAARITAFLGEIAHVAFPDDHHESLPAARRNPQLMGDLIRRAFEDWLSAESEAQPVLFVLEDLHFGDAGTVGLLDSALRNLRERSIMVLGLARPEIRQTFPDLWAGRGVQSFEIGPLPRKTAEKLVREALGPEAPPALTSELCARADGNPFFLEELVRAAREGRAGALPDSVLGTVQARLDAEGERAKQILRAASVFGDRFSRHGLAALLGGEAELPEVVSWLERLVDRELVSRGSLPEGAEGEFTFAHALIREAAYAALTAADLVLGHRLAGEHLEAAGCPDAMVLAEHFRRGHELGRAVGWYREAADQALRACDLPGAIARADVGLEALAQLGAEARARVAAETPGALRLVQAEAHLWRGQLAEAEQRGAQASEALAAGQALWFRAVGQTIISLAKQGKLEAMLGWIERAAAAPVAAEADNARLLCFGWAASFLLVAARLREADDLLAQIAAALGAASSPDPQAVALLHQGRAARASLEADPAACLTELEACKAAFEKAGDTRNLATVRANIGFVLSELGAWERATELLEGALADAERLGLVELSAVVQHNLGRVQAARGNLALGEKLERQALESFRAQGEPRLEGLARVYLAEIRLLAGSPADAAAEATIAARVLGNAPAPRIMAEAVLARARLALGEVAAALEAATRAARGLDELGSIDEGEGDVRLVESECLAAAGQKDAARAAIARAQARLAARAERIGDPELRQRFLSDVPAHARTRALASSWAES